MRVGFLSRRVSRRPSGTKRSVVGVDPGLSPLTRTSAWANFDFSLPGEFPGLKPCELRQLFQWPEGQCSLRIAGRGSWFPTHSARYAEWMGHGALLMLQAGVCGWSVICLWRLPGLRLSSLRPGGGWIRLRNRWGRRWGVGPWCARRRRRVGRQSWCRLWRRRPGPGAGFF